jgi:hypothetical protein
MTTGPRHDPLGTMREKLEAGLLDERVSVSEDGRRAHQLAGRAVAAVLVGAYVEDVSLETE